jgi:putative transposase
VSDTAWDAWDVVNTKVSQVCDKMAATSCELPRRLYALAMGRPPRSFESGVYHIAAHGSDERHLFNDDDRTEFLDRLGHSFWKLGIELIVYVLMTNHYHALAYTPDDRISRALQGLHGGYSLHHNQRHGRRAHLFRAHCLARQIVDDDDLLRTSRYLALNPVEAGLVLDPVDWPWSSARVHAGLAPAPIPLDDHRLRAALGDSTDWRDRYRSLIELAHIC